MKKIESQHVIIKIKNFIKTYESVVADNKDPAKTLKVGNAVKVMLRFLKSDGGFDEFCDLLEASESIPKVYELVKKIEENDFTLAFDEDVTNDDEALKIPVKDDSKNVVKDTETGTQLPKKLLIVVEESDHYYIAFATPQDTINSAFLKSFSTKSAHFETLDKVMSAVEVCKEAINGGYEVEVSHINMDVLLNREYRDANQQHVINDQNGDPIISIDSQGKITLIMRDEDIDCLIIDKIKYNTVIEMCIKMEKKNVSEDFDHYYIGKINGYELALECDAPHARYEIFKALSIISGYDNYPEIRDTFEYDERYYKGYVDALKDVLRIQRGCIHKECKWTVDLIDLRTKNCFSQAFDFESDLPRYGHFSVHIYNELPQINYQDGSRHIVIVLINKKTDWYSKEYNKAFSLPNDVPFIFGSPIIPMNQSKLLKLVTTSIKAQCSLGNGDATYRIPVDMVPALEDYSSFFKDEYDDDDKSDSEEFNESMNLSKKSLDLRFDFSPDTIVREYFKENRVVQCVKLPFGMTELPERVFYNCTALKHVSLPNDIKQIGEAAFYGCSALAKLFLPDGLRKIEDNGFYGCSGIKNIFLPNALEYIGSAAFAGCTKLSSIYIPPNIKYIADDAFDNCTNLKWVEAPVGCILPVYLLTHSRISYYSVDETTGNSQRNRNNTATAVDDHEIHQGTDEKTIESTRTTSELLGNVMMLLEEPVFTKIRDLPPVFNLLCKEYKK